MAVTGSCTSLFHAEPTKSSQSVSKKSSNGKDELTVSGSGRDDSEDGLSNEDSSDEGSGEDSEAEVHEDSDEEISKEVDDKDRGTSENDEPALHPAVSSGDFGQVVQLKAQRNLTDKEKFFLLKHHFVPTKGHQFPARVFSQRQRHFQSSWLDKYNGLVYSESEDGGYCKFCVLFARCEASVKELGVLVIRPLTNFKKAIDKLNEHFGSKGRKFHQAAVERAIAFCAVMENQAVSIDRQLSSARDKLVTENRLKLQSIAATIIFCGRQALALRGHRDDGPELLNDTSVGRGNFQALLQFCIEAGDEVLKHHLETADRNAVYTSKEIQNEMIIVCDNIIRNKILQRIREAQFFSVIADEATDSANDEQLSISIRFVEGGTPCEKFLSFHECDSGVTGEAIASYILTQLSKWQLPPQFLRGQAYDGAGAMAGRSKGAAACITSLHPKALYTHCAAHRLNLCVVKCCASGKLIT